MLQSNIYRGLVDRKKLINILILPKKNLISTNWFGMQEIERVGGCCMQPYYQNINFKTSDFPNSELYYGRAPTLPLFASMTFEQQDEIVSVLSKILL